MFKIIGKTFLIDCDGILANFSEKARADLKNRYGIEVTCDGKNWDYFDYPEVLPHKYDMWNYIVNTKGWVRGLNKYDYAEELVSRLREFGKVICISAVPPGPYFACERIDWLIEELGFNKRDILLGYPKNLVSGDVFIDDKPANVVAWAQRWYGVPVLWNAPGWVISPPENGSHIFQTGSVDTLFDHLRKMKVIP